MDDLVVAAARCGWLTLTFMMLLSRVAFQAAGAARMRSFLDRWREAGARRVWGGASLGFAAALISGAAASGTAGLDLVVVLALVALLVADGLVNVLPSGFRTFKDSVQEAWVRRHRDDGRASDDHLFAWGNLALALASAAVAAFVIAYDPIAGGTIALAAALALVLTPTLILAALRPRASSNA